MSAVRYSSQDKAQALQQVHGVQNAGYSRRAAVQQVAQALGCRAETLNGWLRRQTHQLRTGSGTGAAARLRFLEGELLRLQRLNRELQQQLRGRVGGDDGCEAESPR